MRGFQFLISTIKEGLFAEDAALYAFHFSSLSLDSSFCCNDSIAKIGISDSVVAI